MTSNAGARERLFDELRRLDLLLAAAVARFRADPVHRGFDQYRGLFLTEGEIDALLGAGGAGAPQPGNADETLLLRAAENLRRAAPEGESPLDRLATSFALTEFDRNVVLLCLAPELSRKYEKLYAYLQNDVMRKYASADLAMELFCDSLDERLDARARFLDSAPLVRRHVLTTPETSESESWLARPLRLERQVASWLLSGSSGAPDVRDPKISLSDLALPWTFMERAGALLDHGCSLLVLAGAEGCGKRSLAEALARSRGLRLLTVAVSAWIGLDAPALARRARTVSRNALLEGALVLLEDPGLLHGEENERASISFLDSLKEIEAPCVLASTRAPRGDLLHTREGVFVLDMPMPTVAERKKLWRTAAPGLDAESNATIAGRYRMHAGRIHRAAQSAALAAIADGRRPTRLEDFQQACRDHSLPQITRLAQKIQPIREWNDLVLTPDVEEHLREVCAHVDHRETVLHDWSFERKLSLGRGLSALFTGAPGTGKTMAAEVIANTLRLDLFQIDLSCVVSKYIGETEKNLSRIFEEAADSNAILFFDEADALFGKRSEVRDSHDRYANIEINYLLQRMEQYEGFVILASNFMKNIDDAFRRRVRFVVEFPMPDEDLRQRIWRGVFPAEVPIAADADFLFLARKFRVSGGNIRNIALSATFLAAQEQCAVGMSHLIRATRRELQKLGRLCVRADFDHYFDMVEPEAASV